MKFKKVCACCGKEFETNSPQKIYCDDIHYLPCPVCGKLVEKKDKDFTRPPKCCSSACTHELRKRSISKRKCIFCSEEFTPKSGNALVCNKTHYRNCEICGKQMLLTIQNKDVTTCSPECTKEKLRRRSQERYGTDHPMQSKEVQKNFHDAMEKKYGVRHALQIPGKVEQQQEHVIETNMERNGVPYACMLPQCAEAQGKIVSNLNKEFADKIDELGIQYSFERRIDNRSFDLCIEDKKTLIEIDPTYTHSTVKTHWGTSVDKYYHRDKTSIAEDNGYRLIHIFDWDDKQKILNMLIPQRKLFARKMTVYKLNPKVADAFLNDFHIQGTCRGQLLCLGLVYDDVLYQVMTFGKSRYDKNHYVELLRLCTRPGHVVVGGASRLFSYATSEYGLNSIISYCDRSKFIGDVYEKMGMQFLRTTPPQEIWSKGNRRITANLLRQRGYDQLFGTSYGKGTSNEELMLEHGWLPIYDCGQRVYEFK